MAPKPPPATDETPPQTTLTPVKPLIKAKKGKKKVSVTFTFSSSEAGSSFACSIDGGAFQPCNSPLRKLFGKGGHSFAVRATDAAGNTDATPAQAAFKVKVKKKRKR